MMTRLTEKKEMKWFVTAGMMILMMLVLAFVPVRVQAAGRCNAPAKVKVPKKTKKKACISVKIRWQKSNGADGYIIYRSASRFGGYKQIKDVKSDGALVYNDSSVREAKVYYYKVGAYKNHGGRKVFCQFTSLKVDKVMKTVRAKKTTLWAKIKDFFF